MEPSKVCKKFYIIVFIYMFKTQNLMRIVSALDKILDLIYFNRVAVCDKQDIFSSQMMQSNIRVLIQCVWHKTSHERDSTHAILHNIEFPQSDIYDSSRRDIGPRDSTQRVRVASMTTVI